MTWFDELDEQTQQGWRKRIAKGRLDLSASVEETLAEPPPEQEVWLDEYDEYEEVDGMNVVDADVEKASARTAIIPPRLSLQTRPMTVVAEPERANVPPPVDGGQSTSHSGQQPNVFTRLAQRLTSSLAAITAPFQISEPELPPVREASKPVPAPGNTLQRDAGIQSVTTTTTIIGASPVPYPPSVGVPSPQPQIPQGKPRPAGYPTKVHLQAAPKGISLHPPVNANASVAYSVHENTEPLALRKSLPSPRSAPTALPPKSPHDAVSVQPDEKPSMTTEAISKLTTSGRLPTVHVPEKKTEEAGQVVQAALPAEAGRVASTSLPGATFGSGMFEAGQGDVAINNQHITSASIVNVMLSSDPGPVVVQYVSLQPGIGFTIYLSAPTRMKTTFNYAVFQGEL